MSEEMIDRNALAIRNVGAFIVFAADKMGLQQIEDLRIVHGLAQDERLREALDADVRRRLLSVATTLETCGKHGIPIDFAMLASDIRSALSPLPQGEAGS